MEQWTVRSTAEENLFLVNVAEQGRRRRSYYVLLNRDGSLAWVKRLPPSGGTVPLDKDGPTAEKVFAAVRRTLDYRHQWG